MVENAWDQYKHANPAKTELTINHNVPGRIQVEFVSNVAKQSLSSVDNSSDKRDIKKVPKTKRIRHIKHVGA